MPEPEQIIPEAGSLFSEEAFSNKAFKDAMTRLLNKDGRAPDGRPWNHVVTDFLEKSSPDAGEIYIGMVGGTEIKYGYYTFLDDAKKRLGNMPAVFVPAGFWKDKNLYNDTKIGEMLIKVMEISRKKMISDDDRVQGEEGLYRLFRGVSPVEEYVVPKISMVSA